MKEHTIVLGCMDLDLALRMNESSKPTETSSANDKVNYEKWECSNRMCIMIMKHSIPNFIWDAMPEETKAKAFLS